MHNNDAFLFLRKLTGNGGNLFIQQLIFLLGLILRTINIAQGFDGTLYILKGLGIKLHYVDFVGLQHRNKFIMLIFAGQNKIRLQAHKRFHINIVDHAYLRHRLHRFGNLAYLGAGATDYGAADSLNHTQI